MIKDGKIASEKTVNTSVNLPKEVHEALVHRATVTDTNVSMLIKVAIDRYLQWLDFLDFELDSTELDNVDKLYRLEYEDLRKLRLELKRARGKKVD